MTKEVEAKQVDWGVTEARGIEYFKKQRMFKECQMLQGTQVGKGVRKIF